MTRRSAASPTSAPTRMQVPSGRAISIRRSSATAPATALGSRVIGTLQDVAIASGIICTGMNTGA